MSSLGENIAKLKATLLKRLTPEEVDVLTSSDSLSMNHADMMRENVISLLPVPLGFIDELVVNGRTFIVPLAIEQKGIVEMVKRGSNLVTNCGGFTAESSEQIMIGQIQVVGVDDVEEGIRRLASERCNLLLEANTMSSKRRAVNLKARRLDTEVGPMLIAEIYVDVKDSMGANIVNSMCEAISPAIESITGGRVNIAVLTNLSSRRMVRVQTRIPGGRVCDDVIKGIVNASAFAVADPYRAVTHNTGIMNGVSAVLLATGNDTRAVEAGAHAYASLSGVYRPLSVWVRGADGGLVGGLEMPLSVGTVGGIVDAHPVARINLKLLGVEDAAELQQIVASVGLAANLGALYTLVTEGIMSIQ
ncbi:MAG: hydroxymethylglutaryl-CoA reductase, degradative [Candidatus Bathyarchaeota archaeon]|nr:hydroxymethylglutaryl-CoA reductase, degradative [Candidatus Bathyarchaeota archaeon]